MTQKKLYGTTWKHPIEAIFQPLKQLCCEYNCANHDLSKTYPDLKGRIEVEEIVRTEGLRFWKLQFGSELNQKLSRDVGNLREGVLFNKISEIMLRVTTKGVAQHDWKINL